MPECTGHESVDPSMHWAGGVSQHGGCLPGGVSAQDGVSTQGGVCPEGCLSGGCLPGGCLPGGVCLRVSNDGGVCLGGGVYLGGGVSFSRCEQNQRSL